MMVHPLGSKNLVELENRLSQLPSSVKELHLDLQFMMDSFMWIHKWEPLTSLLGALPKGLEHVHVHLGYFSKWPYELNIRTRDYSKTNFVFSLHCHSYQFISDQRLFSYCGGRVNTTSCGGACWMEHLQ